MAGLIEFVDVKEFEAAGEISGRDISDAVLDTVAALDEREELEPYIQTILADSNQTPHGPAEIVDILTHKVTINRRPAFAAFVLKGKSFKTVRPADVSHQIYRLEKIDGLDYAVFATVGNVLDAVKEQFVSTAERLGVAYSILDATDLGRLLIAYGFVCPRDGSKLVAGRCDCGFVAKHKSLNILQRESLKELQNAHRFRQSAGLVVLPTGSGKTRVAAKDAKRAKANHVLYVAHTHEILDVAEREFASEFGSENVRRVQDGRELVQPAQVSLITIQLLRNQLAKLLDKKFDYVVVDEFHHAAAKSYRAAINGLSPEFLLGMTATPFREDRQDISELCDGRILVHFELRYAVDCGILAPYHYYGCFDDIDYSALNDHEGNYSVRDLEKTLIVPERDAAIANKWREYAENRPTLAFCCSRTHARRFAANLNEHGIPASTYLADTSYADRRKLEDAIRTGDIRILCAVDVLNEGTDFPFVEALLFLRPTNSKRIFMQQLGRGLRRHVGKTHCTVIDFIGNFKNAYRILDYHGITPQLDDPQSTPIASLGNAKELLNLPSGCKVHIDSKVLDIFSSQILDPQNATRHNIGKILIYEYRKLERHLGRVPTRKDVNRLCLLSSKYYERVFGSWSRFEDLVKFTPNS